MLVHCYKEFTFRLSFSVLTAICTTSQDNVVDIIVAGGVQKLKDGEYLVEVFFSLLYRKFLYKTHSSLAQFIYIVWLFIFDFLQETRNYVSDTLDTLEEKMNEQVSFYQELLTLSLSLSFF